MSSYRRLLTVFSAVLLLCVGLTAPTAAQSDILPMPYSGAEPGIVQRAPFEVPAHLLPATRVTQAYTVTRFDDPAVSGCAPQTDGLTLREAIFHCTNASTQPTIYLPAGTYTLSSTIVTSARSFVLIGESPLNTFIQPVAGVRSFDLGLAIALPPTTVTIANVTIQNSTSGASGNALRVVGGGIINLDNVRVQNNTGSVRGTVRFDVEINARMTIAISNSTFVNNTASAGAGIALTNELGSGTLTATITDSLISSNTVTGNGGNLLVNNTSGTLTSLTVNNSTLSGGSAGNGGGIAVSGDTTPTLITLNDTAITGNTATLSGGGGIYFDSAAGELLLQNSTVNANSITNSGATGGGLFAVSGRQFTFRGTTFASNTALNGVAGAMQFSTNVAVITLEDTVVRDNSAGDIGGIYAFLVDSVTANRLIVTGNSATGEVGGMLLAPSNYASLTDSSITLNSAGLEMGGLRTGRTTLRNVSIEDNSAPISPDCEFNVLSGDSYSLGGVFITNMSGCTASFTPAEGDLIGNLVHNGGFESEGATPALPSGWNFTNVTGDRRSCNSPTVTFTPYGNCLMRFKGGAGESATLTQNIDLTGLTFAADEELRLTAFGDGANGNSFLRIRIIARYSDAPKNQSTVVFSGNQTGLTRASQVITLSSANVTRLTVQVTH
ncbi:MAG: hypothetical protein MUF38_07135, partial [Anaerolineae bacterium]|nr:hypothetical protein [Anaerolineae bacterium]